MRIESVGEPGLDAGADVLEGKRRDRRIQPGGEAGRVLVHLQLDAGQGVSDRLRLENAGGLAADEQHVVGEPVAGRHAELAHRDPEPGGKVHPVPVLDRPARLDEHRVDPLAGLLFGCQRHPRSPGAGSHPATSLPVKRLSPD